MTRSLGALNSSDMRANDGDACSRAVLAAGWPADADAIAERIDAPETIGQLDANTREAAGRGAFGSPTIFVGDTLFFGNDRLDFVREHLASLEEAA